MITCEYCEGTGQRGYIQGYRHADGATGWEQKTVTCPICGGTGQRPPAHETLAEVEARRSEGLRGTNDEGAR